MEASFFKEKSHCGTAYRKITEGEVLHQYNQNQTERIF